MAKKPRGDEAGNFHIPEGDATEEELRDHVHSLELPSELRGPVEFTTHLDLPSGQPQVMSATETKKTKKTPEGKRADFNRLASARVSRAIDALSSLLHLANTTTYDWTDEARVKIFSTIRDKIDTVEASFVAAKAPTDGKRKSSKQLSFRVDL